MRKEKYTEKELKIVCDVLIEFSFCDTMDEVWEAWDFLYHKYRLMTSPYTLTPCTPKEYEGLMELYNNRQEL